MSQLFLISVEGLSKVRFQLRVDCLFTSNQHQLETFLELLRTELDS